MTAPTGTTKHRKLKTITFKLNSQSYECQVQSWTLDPGMDEGERMFSFCGPDGGSFIEEPDPEPTLEMVFYADWSDGGISDFLWTNTGTVADFELHNHPNSPDQHVKWTGQVRIAAPPAGGEARATEMTEVTMQLLDLPAYERVSTGTTGVMSAKAKG